MSELIQKNDNRATIRWKLLTGASALALTAYVSSASTANAEDNHPLVWLEFSGDASVVTGEGQPFDPAFIAANAGSPAFDPVSPLQVQKPPPFSFGGDAKISFQPENSDWVFSAGIRFGRSGNNRYTHQQSHGLPIPTTSPLYQYASYFLGGTFAYATGFVNYAEFKAHHRETHAILDFQAGKDVGLGMFGANSTSVISAGVRMARFDTDASIRMRVRPDLKISDLYNFLKYHQTFHHYYLSANAQRSFHGIGPAISWDASVPLAGNPANGELAFDWGINAALLFGKQKAKVHHHTTGYYGYSFGGKKSHYSIPATPTHSRSRSVTVPNLGASAAIAYHFQDAKVSIGYRYDTFFNAMDTGIDTAHKSAMTFKGPFASISIGLGD